MTTRIRKPPTIERALEYHSSLVSSAKAIAAAKNADLKSGKTDDTHWDTEDVLYVALWSGLDDMAKRYEVARP